MRCARKLGASDRPSAHFYKHRRMSEAIYGRMSVTQEQAVRAEILTGDRRSPDRARFWREASHGNLECLHARFVRHTYAPHVHETYTFGTITHGVEVFHAYGGRHFAVPGLVTVLNPDVLHDGAPSGEGYEYRMAYPSVDLMAEVAEDVLGPGFGLPFFAEPLYDDPELARRTAQMHLLFQSGAPRLQSETALVDCLSSLILRHADARPFVRKVGRETALVSRVCDMLEDDLSLDVDLKDLAMDAGVSRYQLIRAFKSELGITPHAVRTRARISRARRLLGSGADIAETALSCGFYDQSHFSKTFKGVVGVTPGQYRADMAA